MKRHGSTCAHLAHRLVTGVAATLVYDHGCRCSVKSKGASISTKGPWEMLCYASTQWLLQDGCRPPAHPRVTGRGSNDKVCSSCSFWLSRPCAAEGQSAHHVPYNIDSTLPYTVTTSYL